MVWVSHLFHMADLARHQLVRAGPLLDRLRGLVDLEMLAFDFHELKSLEDAQQKFRLVMEECLLQREIHLLKLLKS